ncbi:MAG TPA: spore protease YyaC [Thermaerobacter sp.]
MSRTEAGPAAEGPALPPFRAELRVRADDPDGWRRLGETLARWLAQRGGHRVAVVCIGTDRSTGDALGPLVGTLLDRDRGLPRETVDLLGTLDEPVHAGNLDQAVARLAALDEGTTVLAIDACLGRSENVGTISAGRGALQPGAGVNKTLPAVGHLFVTGTVNVGGFMEYFVLQNTRLGLVLRMAEAIAAGVAWGLRLYLEPLRSAEGPRDDQGPAAGGLARQGTAAQGALDRVESWAAWGRRRSAWPPGADGMRSRMPRASLSGAAAAAPPTVPPEGVEPAPRGRRPAAEGGDGGGTDRSGFPLGAPTKEPAPGAAAHRPGSGAAAGWGTPPLPESCRLRLLPPWE